MLAFEELGHGAELIVGVILSAVSSQGENDFVLVIQCSNFSNVNAELKHVLWE